MAERFTATYRIETPRSAREAAEAMAGEQSASTFVDIEAETAELQERHGGDVVDVTELGSVPEPTLPGATPEPGDADESVIASARAVQDPIPGDDGALPVFSSGQWAKQAPETYERLGNADLLYLSGGGIMGHPGGPAAGVAALKQGWEAATSGISLEEYARDHEELRASMEAFGDDE